jgi:CDP-glucose 4,6-dehydratase
MTSSNYWADKSVFITGCSGLLGSWLTKRLVAENANVVGLVRDTIPKSYLHLSKTDQKIILVRGEIENFSLLERIINEYEVDFVFHLAAQTIVSIANKNPMSTFKSNIEGTWNLLEACRRTSAGTKIVVASSDKAYGTQKTLPYNEQTPLEGRHPYDVSKSCADLLCRSYFETYGTPVCVTRCGNFYAGGDLNFNRIVPGTIKSLIDNQRPKIRSDGSYIRDYFYIKDGVESYLTLAEAMESAMILGEAFNFSTENPLSVLELVTRIIRQFGSDVEPVVLNTATNEIKSQYLSAKKAREVLNWKPRYSLEDGLQETIDWYRKFFGHEPL